MRRIELEEFCGPFVRVINLLHPCLVSVLEHVESGRSPMLTCLGETFRGLDEAKSDRKAIRKGSLVLLQVKIRSE